MKNKKNKWQLAEAKGTKMMCSPPVLQNIIYAFMLFEFEKSDISVSEAPFK